MEQKRLKIIFAWKENFRLRFIRWPVFVSCKIEFTTKIAISSLKYILTFFILIQIQRICVCVIHFSNSDLYFQYGRGKMVQLADLFSVPEICLLCNISEYFERQHFDYHPEILFRDVKVGFVT